MRGAPIEAASRRTRSTSTSVRIPNFRKSDAAADHSRSASEGMVSARAACLCAPPGKCGAILPARWTGARIRRIFRQASASRWGGKGYAVFGGGGDYGTAYVERAEIYDAIRDARLTGFLTVSGDRHSFWAGLAAKALPPERFEPVGAAFITGSLSAVGLVEAFEYSFPKDHPLRALYVADVGRYCPAGGESASASRRAHVSRVRAKRRHHCALARSRIRDLAPHLSFLDLGGHGYAVLRRLGERWPSASSCAFRGPSSALIHRTAGRCAIASFIACRCGTRERCPQWSSGFWKATRSYRYSLRGMMAMPSRPKPVTMSSCTTSSETTSASWGEARAR